MNNNRLSIEEKELHPLSGMVMLITLIIAELLSLCAFVFGMIAIDETFRLGGLLLIIAGALLGFIVIPVMFSGLKILRPNEALVLTLFGKYYGTLVGAGYFYVNPFCEAINTVTETVSASQQAEEIASVAKGNLPSGKAVATLSGAKKISLKEITLTNDKQKINDQMGNPVIIGTVVIWRVVNAAKAVFNVDNYVEYVSVQSDASLRNVAREYPYDTANDGDDSGDEMSLRGSSLEVAKRLKEELQLRVDVAGIEIVEARITHLAYAPEIAAAMLQRQQASAIIAARKKIVDGAVGMVEMALTRLSENEIVDLDEERKAQMVSNLLVVLCGNKDAQPIVNSGSIY